MSKSFVTAWTAACQGLHSPGALPDPGIEPGSPALQILYHWSHHNKSSNLLLYAHENKPNLDRTQFNTGSSFSGTEKILKKYHLMNSAEVLPHLSLPGRCLSQPGEALSSPKIAVTYGGFHHQSMWPCFNQQHRTLALAREVGLWTVRCSPFIESPWQKHWRGFKGHEINAFLTVTLSWTESSEVST